MLQAETLTVHGVGTKAYLDSFGGLVPCVVVAVKKPCTGKRIGTDEITVKVTANKGGYRKGEVLDRSAAYTPPRSSVRRRGCHLYIRTDYRYE